MFSTSRSAWYWSLIIILGFLGLNTTSFGNQNAPASKSQTKKDNSSKTDLEEKEAPKQTPNNYIRQNIFKGKVVEVNDEKHCFVLEIPFTPKNKVKATFIVTEDAKIRTMVVPTIYDDRGNLKRPSAKELSEMKGKEKNLPGYQSEFANLKRDQILTVHQVTTKEKLLADRQKPRPKPGEKQTPEEYMTSYLEITNEAPR